MAEVGQKFRWRMDRRPSFFPPSSSPLTPCLGKKRRKDVGGILFAGLELYRKAEASSETDLPFVSAVDFVPAVIFRILPFVVVVAES